MTPCLQFSPHLYFGRYRQVQHGSQLDGASQATAYNFLQVLDGTLDCQSPKREQWTLRPEQASIVEPGTQVHWQSEGLFIHLAFDLIPGRRQLGDTGASLITGGRAPQPNWSYLFGISLPHYVDADYLQRSRLLIHRLATAQVSHPVHQLESHAELGRFIAGYLQVLAMADGFNHPGKNIDEISMAEALEMILMDRHQSGISMREAAKILGYSPEQLSRRYRSVRGRTPSRFLQEWRVHRACQLIEEQPQQSFDAIAQAVGLGQANSLNRAFQSVLRCSPRQWRLRECGVRRCRSLDSNA